jgi:hypothetical protein
MTGLLDPSQLSARPLSRCMRALTRNPEGTFCTSKQFLIEFDSSRCYKVRESSYSWRG